MLNVTARTPSQPYQLADKAMRGWEESWSMHDAAVPQLPAEAKDWEELPPLTLQDLQRAIL
eukprot:1425168-Pyramimonas_sp.AAC.1